jgi:hypothetical protein
MLPPVVTAIIGLPPHLNKQMAGPQAGWLRQNGSPTLSIESKV